jgi:hypothetical protein
MALINLALLSVAWISELLNLTFLSVALTRELQRLALVSLVTLSILPIMALINLALLSVAWISEMLNLTLTMELQRLAFCGGYTPSTICYDTIRRVSVCNLPY